MKTEIEIIEELIPEIQKFITFEIKLIGETGQKCGMEEQLRLAGLTGIVSVVMTEVLNIVKDNYTSVLGGLDE